MTEAVLRWALLTPLMHCIWTGSTSMWDQLGEALMRDQTETRLADSVDAEIYFAESWRLLSPGSSDALTAVIHMTVLTWEQGRGVLLPFPVSHHSGPKVCLDMPFPAPLSPATPSTCLQKNHSSFTSHTSRDLWKDAAICFVVVSVNMYYVSENACFPQWIKGISGVTETEWKFHHAF